jgi:hypothetical protein
MFSILDTIRKKEGFVPVEKLTGSSFKSSLLSSNNYNTIANFHPLTNHYTLSLIQPSIVFLVVAW